MHACMFVKNSRGRNDIFSYGYIYTQKTNLTTAGYVIAYSNYIHFTTYVNSD